MEKKEAMKILKDFHDKSALFSVRTALHTIIPELKVSEDEEVRKIILDQMKCWNEDAIKKNCEIDIEASSKCIAWLEKQGEKKDNNKLIWKHWSTGIAGNGEGKPIYLIKHYNTYSISSCLSSECDYILLSDLDKLISDEDNKKITDKNEPKFKVGDWVVNSYGDIWYIDSLDKKNYRLYRY